MYSNKQCFSINTYYQAREVVAICNKSKLIPVLFFKYYLIERFGIDWLIELRLILEDEFESKNFKIYIDTKKNYSFFINLVEQKINYIRVEANKETLKRLKEIALLNKVLINPTFSIVELEKIKYLISKLKKIIK